MPKTKKGEHKDLPNNVSLGCMESFFCKIYQIMRVFFLVINFKKKKSNICILKTNEMKNKEMMQNDKIVSFNWVITLRSDLKL